MTEKNLLQVTPWVIARDFDGMVHYFEEVLGFAVRVNAGGYAYVERDDAAVRIGMGSDELVEMVTAGARAWLFYFDVRDVDGLVAEIRPKLLRAGMTGGDGPVDQTWGKREFWAPLPEGGLIIFGQEILSKAE